MWPASGDRSRGWECKRRCCTLFSPRPPSPQSSASLSFLAILPFLQALESSPAADAAPDVALDCSGSTCGVIAESEGEVAVPVPGRRSGNGGKVSEGCAQGRWGHNEEERSGGVGERGRRGAREVGERRHSCEPCTLRPPTQRSRSAHPTSPLPPLPSLFSWTNHTAGGCKGRWPAHPARCRRRRPSWNGGLHPQEPRRRVGVGE